MCWFVITIFQVSVYSWSCIVVTFMGRGQCTLIVWDYRSELSNLRMWNGVEQGTLEWRMHNSNKIACVMWKDKRPVLLISTHAIPIQAPCIHPKFLTSVPRRNGPVRELVHTSPIHLEYTTRMRGVDVVDQLRALYSCQT
jgi:hypothetical protein